MFVEVPVDPMPFEIPGRSLGDSVLWIAVGSDASSAMSG